ncbi:MAG: MiaB/RimO family radical SAM methylthiotransferase [Actinomycetia bacterium]|nr:MiaB/RimO family radical SAM methylthiotransferase [Actinomycetes bacterium]
MAQRSGLSFAIRNLGCKLNRAESDQMAASLEAAGLHATEAAVADLILINTCTVTAEADAKTRQAIRHALNINPTAWVVACGCAVAIDAASCQTLGERVRAVADHSAAVTAALALLDLAGQGVPEPPALEQVLAKSQPGQNVECSERRMAGQRILPRQRVDLKIQDGCDGQCSYCVVRKARGPSRSLAAAGLIKQLTAIAASGIKEVVLTGVNLGSYQDGSLGLAGVAEELMGHCPDLRLRLSSLEPNDLSPDILALIAASDGRLAAHLHLPLQSGSDAVLAAMRRPYNAADYASIVEAARRIVPRISLSTDVIVGFPGETDADFQKTMEFCRQMAFMNIHVFRYSVRPGTEAAAIADQVDAETKKVRAFQLRQLARQLTLEDIRRRIGSSEKVLVEKPGLGRAESYHLVRMPHDLPVGALVDVCFKGHLGMELK